MMKINICISRKAELLLCFSENEIFINDPFCIKSYLD